MQLLSLDTTSMIYILLGLIIALVLWIVKLEIRIRKMLRGKDVHSIEDAVVKLHTDISHLQKFQGESIEYLKNIEARLKRSIQAVETVRFNPFKGSGEGGNQSFATAFLNEKGDGAVVSSLYSRDRVSVFSKPLKKFSSEFEVTDEEREAIKTAKDSLVHK